MRFIVLIIFIVLISNLSLYTEDYDESYLESVLEKIAEETGSSPVMNEIVKFIEKPLSLKTATVEELLQIPGFSTSMAQKILEITYYSDVSFDELDKELNLTDEQVYLLKLCTTLEKQDKFARKKRIYIKLRNQNQFQTQRGFLTDSFQGTSLNLYQKSTIYYKNVTAGFLFDKDPGEDFKTDFNSAYLAGRVLNTSYILGDFYIDNGMGSILWKSYGMRKGSEVISPVMQIGSGIKPYRSSIDYNFFRGLAVQSDWRLSKTSNISSIFWASYSPRSANIDSSGQYATSLYTSGYYRTQNEIEKKNAINEKSFGANLELQLSSMKFGITSLYLNYSKEIISNAKTSFNGKSGFLSSAYSFLFFENSSYSAEISADAKGYMSAKASAQYKFGDLELAFHYRYFKPGFRSPYGYNLGESDVPANETGLYSGLLWKVFKKLNFSLYVDLYKNLSATQYLPLPNKGVDLLGELDYDITYSTKIRLRYKEEISSDSYKNETDTYSAFTKNISRGRIDIIHLFGNNIKLFLRGEAVYASFDKTIPDEKGILAFADIIWQPLDYLDLGGRVTYFSTDSYSSAIWQFESIVPGYCLSFPLYGTGTKVFAYAGITPFDAVSFGIRYSVLTKKYIESLGSGYNEIQGNMDSRLYLQLDVRF